MKRRTFLLTTTAATVFELPEQSAQAGVQSAKTPGKGFVIKAGADRFGEKTKLFGVTPNDIKVSTKDTSGTLSIFEYNGREKGGPPLHSNDNQDEIYYVIEGRYLFEFGGEKHTLTAGDLIFAPQKVGHTFAQLTDTGRMILLIQPSGKMEDYFRTLGRLTRKLSPQEGAKLFTDHGMQLVGPPLPVD
jgi:quercetin 2,3-dioxygenase